MADDRELFALVRSWEALEPLGPVARRRVLQYLAGRCDEAEAREEELRRAPGSDAVDATAPLPDLGARWKDRFGRRIAERRIRSDTDRALVVAAALQELAPERHLRAREIHRVLKEMDYGVANLASLLRSMAESETKRVRRKKSGKKQFGYQVTEVGMAAASELMEEVP